jgi:hypothetical protein
LKNLSRALLDSQGAFDTSGKTGARCHDRTDDRFEAG